MTSIAASPTAFSRTSPRHVTVNRANLSASEEDVAGDAPSPILSARGIASSAASPGLPHSPPSLNGRQRSPSGSRATGGDWWAFLRPLAIASGIIGLVVVHRLAPGVPSSGFGAILGIALIVSPTKHQNNPLFSSRHVALAAAALGILLWGTGATTKTTLTVVALASLMTAAMGCRREVLQAATYLVITGSCAACAGLSLVNAPVVAGSLGTAVGVLGASSAAWCALLWGIEAQSRRLCDGDRAKKTPPRP